MRMRVCSLLGIVAAVLILAACGSSKKSTSSTSASVATSTPTVTTVHHAKKRKHHVRTVTKVYRLKLSGKVEVPKGAPKGIGDAVVALHVTSHKVCWRFSHLHGFTSATFAHIHKGRAGKSGPIVVPLSTGAKLKHAGCVGTSAKLIKAIAKDPHAYYVNIHSKKYPAGAVRSQL